MNSGAHEGAQGTMCQVGVRTPKGQDDQEPAFDEPHIERQGRRQRHPAQQLQVRAATRL